MVMGRLSRGGRGGRDDLVRRRRAEPELFRWNRRLDADFWGWETGVSRLALILLQVQRTWPLFGTPRFHWKFEPSPLIPTGCEMLSKWRAKKRKATNSGFWANLGKLVTADPKRIGLPLA